MSEPAARQFRTLVVGAGAIGLRHLELLRQRMDVSQIAIAEPRKEVRAALTAQGIQAYSSLDESLAFAPEIAVVCTPNGSHARQAIQLLEAGTHVLIEKPLATSIHDAEAVCRAATANKRFAAVVLQNRLTSSVRWLKSLLEDHVLGRILLAEVSLLWNRDDRYYAQAESPWRGDTEADAGVLFTQFSHFVDLLLHLLGPLEVSSAKLRNFTHPTLSIPDTGIVHFTAAQGSDKGLLGSLNFTTSVYDRNAESRLTLVGTTGTVTLSGQYADVIRYFHCLTPTIDIAESLPVDRLAGHRAVWDEFLASVNAGPPFTYTNLDTAADTVAFICAVHRLATTSNTHG